jgi:hypothetical protein
MQKTCNDKQSHKHKYGYIETHMYIVVRPTNLNTILNSVAIDFHIRLVVNV